MVHKTNMTNKIEFSTKAKMNEVVNSIAHLESVKVLAKDDFQSVQFDSKEAHNNFLKQDSKITRFQNPHMV